MHSRTKKPRFPTGGIGCRTLRAFGTVLALWLITSCGGGDQRSGPKTWSVSLAGDGDFQSIQACIIEALAGDTCLVKAGHYRERIRFFGKAIRVRSSLGRASTVLDGTDGGTVVKFRDSETAGTIFQGFTVTGGRASLETDVLEHGGGIQLQAASPTILDCIVQGNHADGDGGGIYVFATGARPTLDNVVVQGNTADGQGGGLSAVSGRPHLTNCLIADNQAARGGGVGARSRAEVSLSSCTVADNTATEQAHSLFVANATLDAEYGIVWNQDALEGAAVLVDHDPARGIPTTLTLSYMDLQGGTAGIERTAGCQGSDQCTTPGEQEDVQDLDPLFVPRTLDPLPENPWRFYYLSQTATGRDDQDMDSPGVDAGDVDAASAGLDTRTTRTDGETDVDALDLGYHY